MIPDIDNALRELLLKEIPMRRGEVDITFDQPKREWSARLNKPSLNLYLYDIRENTELRGSEQVLREEIDVNRVRLRHTPTRLDLCYLITGWAKEVQDEHRLLSSALMTFLRHPQLPDELLPTELRTPALPIHIKIAQGKATHEITDLWNALDNELRPGLRLTITLALEPMPADVVAPVRTTQLDFMQNPNPDALAAAAANPNAAPPVAVPSRKSFMVNGKVSSQKYSPAVLKLILSETGKGIDLSEDGRFKIARLLAGEYHLDILANDRLLKRQTIQVPSPGYEFEV